MVLIIWKIHVSRQRGDVVDTNAHSMSTPTLPIVVAIHRKHIPLSAFYVNCDNISHLLSAVTFDCWYCHHFFPLIFECVSCTFVGSSQSAPIFPWGS